VVRKKLRFYIAFCIINPVPILFIINPLLINDVELKNNVEYIKPFIISYISAMICREILFIIFACNTRACTIAADLKGKIFMNN
jgi:hypothetical protein